MDVTLRRQGSQEAQRAIQTVFNPWNRSITVAHLPDDLLAEIFFFLCAPGRLHRDNDWNWITITHICRWWRSLALRLASLWSHIYTTDLEYLKTCLQRSRNCPVKLDIPLRNPESQNWAKEFVEIVLPHMDRIVGFLIFMDEDDVDIITDMLSNHPFNKANQIRLGTSGQPRLVTLPPFKDNHPLTWLILQNFILPWNVPCFHEHLRLLVLSDQGYIGSGDGRALENLLDMLAQCKRLEYLALDNFSPRDDDLPVNANTNLVSRRRLKLPACLQDFSLDGRIPEDIVHLLPHFDIPATTTVQLRCFDLDESHTIHGIRDIIPSDISGIPHLQHVNSIIMSAEEDVLRINLKFRSFQTADLTIDLSCGIEEFHPQTGDPLVPDYFPAFEISYFKSLREVFFGSATITHFSFTGHYVFKEIDSPEWAATFAAFPLLTVVELSQYPSTQSPQIEWVECIFDGLQFPISPFIVDNGNVNPAPTMPMPDIVCPRLTHLWFRSALIEHKSLAIMESSLRRRSERGTSKLVCMSFIDPRWKGEEEEEGWPGWPNLKPFVESFDYNLSPQSVPS
ncbi:hypothetical protein ABKN59_010725 [Abortiporus biennis]